MQSKVQSFIEANFNTFSGTIINWLAGLLIYPLFDLPVPVWDVTGITLCFTVISVFKNYAVRRFFPRCKTGPYERKTYHLCAEGCENISKISSNDSKILYRDTQGVSKLKDLLNTQVTHHGTKPTT